MRRTLVLALALAFGACAKEPAPEQTSDSLYFGGTIVTMAPGAPEIEAVAVKGGLVVDMGTFEAMHDSHAGALTRMIDLDGGTMFPGVVDPMQAADIAGVLAALAPDSARGPAAIEIGKVADFVIFDRNPAEGGAEGQAGIRVMRIVRSGETVYRAED